MLLTGCYCSCKKNDGNKQVVIEETKDNYGSSISVTRDLNQKSKKKKRYKRRKKQNIPIIIPQGTKLKARVIHVVDADTVYLETLDKKIWIKGRLAGINSPECHKKRVKLSNGKTSSQCKTDDEAFGLNAFLFVNKLISGKQVELTCVKKGKKCKSGRFNRPLITIFYKGKDINKTIIANGYGFAFTKYPSDKRAEYCGVEFDARKLRVGLWSLGKTVDAVLSFMSYKTRKWYRKHDKLCRISMGLK